MNPAVRLVAVLCIAALMFGVGTGTAVAVAEPANGQFIVELDTNGDANIVFTDVFDLTDPDQREIFEDARENEELRAAAAEQLRHEMQFVSDAVSEDLDRELHVGDVMVETIVEGEAGIVAYQFRWENLAVVDGERLILREPFATYDSIDRELIVFAPEGAELTSVSPPPERQGTDVATWPGLTQFGDRFEVVSSGAEQPEEADRTDEELPPISHAEANTETYGSAPLALGVSVLVLASLFIGRKQ